MGSENIFLHSMQHKQSIAELVRDINVLCHHAITLTLLMFFFVSSLFIVFLQQLNAPMWQMSNSEHDGLTTNGIAVMRPTGTFESGVSPGEWREVTVMGSVRKLRAQRSSRSPGEPVSFTASSCSLVCVDSVLCLVNLI